MDYSLGGFRNLWDANKSVNANRIKFVRRLPCKLFSLWYTIKCYSKSKNKLFIVESYLITAIKCEPISA